MSIHNIRAVGSYIRGTNGTSNGIVPMLRVFNDTARQKLLFPLLLHLRITALHAPDYGSPLNWHDAGMWIKVGESVKVHLPFTLSHGMLTSLSG